MRRLLRALAHAFVFLTIAIPFAAWLIGWAVILAGGSGETVAIKHTGRPASYRMLAFGPWQPGAGPCLPGHLEYDMNGMEGAEILEHRVGTIYGQITWFCYYEAKYKLLDGKIRIAHADGPLPLINHRIDTPIVGSLLSAAIAGLLYYFSARRQTTANPGPERGREAESM